METRKLTDLEILDLFCSTDEGDSRRATPFSFGELCYTVNGFGSIAVRINAKLPEVTRIESDLALKIDEVIDEAYKNVIKLNELPKNMFEDGFDCIMCSGIGKVTTCQECAGNGEIEFTSESGRHYSAECQVCEGDGYHKDVNGSKCPECSGTGKMFERPSREAFVLGQKDPNAINRIGQRSYDRNLLYRISLLNDLRIDYSNNINNNATYFEFDRGDGVVLRCREGNE